MATAVRNASAPPLQHPAHGPQPGALRLFPLSFRFHKKHPPRKFQVWNLMREGCFVMPVISAPGHSSPEARHGVLYFVVSEVWAPLVDTAHLVNSIRTRSAPVSITMVFSFTAQMVR